MDSLKNTIDKLIENELYLQTKLMLSGQYAELCKCNGRLDAFNLVKNLLRFNYNIE